jgi:hypothetical protein
MLLVAGIARQLLAAAGVALVGGLMVIDAHLVRSCPLLIVPLVGLALTLGALITSRSRPAGIYGDGRGETKSRR